MQPSSRIQYRYYDLVMATFVTVLLLSNLLSSAKIIDIGLGSVGSLSFIFDAGTIVFPISYIFGDILTEVYGYKRSRRVIWMGFGASILMAFCVWIVGLLPGEAYWTESTGQSAYDAILSGIPNLIVASLSAYFAGEFLNSFVLAKLKVATEGRYLWMRTIGSTLIGEGADSIIFVGIATLLGTPGFVAEIMLSLIATNYILKVSIEAAMTPITYKVVNTLKRVENEDYYDRDTNFNPFKLGI
ncbi:MAG: transporter [Chloroflexota bacterium]|nr:VUT family protein [Chloroflexota bacterium]NOG62382.1 queuosine precursor transporter [Chloroflexota bacterium]GIK64075.1 MAG: transporter [Chloroflexota bacterium]